MHFGLLRRVKAASRGSSPTDGDTLSPPLRRVLSSARDPFPSFFVSIPVSTSVSISVSIISRSSRSILTDSKQASPPAPHPRFSHHASLPPCILSGGCRAPLPRSRCAPTSSPSSSALPWTRRRRKRRRWGRRRERFRGRRRGRGGKTTCCRAATGTLRRHGNE